MKNYFALLFTLMFTQNVLAVNAYDILLSIRNGTNTGYINLIPASPTTTDGIFYFTQAAHTASWVDPGNISVVGGALRAPQADWNATTGNNVIANKPAIPTNVSDLANDSGFLTASSGVTPAVMATALDNYPSNSVMASALSGKMDALAGTNLQYVRGDGSVATIKTDLSQFINGPGFLTSVPAQSFSSLTGLPTTRAGYGITDAESLGAAAAAQSYSIQRSNHTGTQSADTVTDGVTNKAFLATERTKLAGIATGATVNDTDSNLKNRANHTGTITASVVSDFNTAADARVAAGITGKFNTPSGTTSQVVLGNGTLGALPAPQAIQRLRVQTDASGNYTWTYPVAYGSGIVPIISAVSESSSSTVPQGVQIVGVPTNTSATFKVINLPSTSVLSIVVVGAPTAAQAYIHLTAIAP